jgi:hypothetical protein
VQERCKLDVSFGEGYLDMRPLGSYDGTLDRYMINLVIMLPLLPFIFQGEIGTSHNSIVHTQNE